ncbi:hypothetical protein BGZ80_001957 [Entomortierella chlamydospora]|uniref:Uncharacterized protein n=1 Tax=Entomortierella chlamydospora TaxID=101097 RepID=A0A9P6MQR3_9FUNG|nr:hypothetical protein BGZ79_001845 [Entomortierella chlamydospora]KAG0009890.1 hypothetical protein BGZ80_001957 [Entomortierella chlamydospora]
MATIPSTTTMTTSSILPMNTTTPASSTLSPAPTPNINSSYSGGFGTGGGYNSGVANPTNDTSSLQIVFYVIAFLGLVFVIAYTAYAARRRRLRRLARENGNDDPEMAQVGDTTVTYRPESGDEGKYFPSPPRYGSYVLDQPYTETTSALPDQVHYETYESWVSLIQRAVAFGQRQLLRDTDSTRPVVTTTTTTTTTTVTTTSFSEPRQPITPPSQAHTFLEARPFSILRHGLFHHNNSNTSSRNSLVSSQAHSEEVSIYVPPTRPGSHHSVTENNVSSDSSVVDIHVSNSDDDNNDNSHNGTGPEMTEQPLCRLRSCGPPPYIPSGDEAPALPPSYNTVAVTPVATPISV